MIVSSLLIAQSFLSSSAFAGKNVNVNRNSGPWMKTVFVDAFYGSVVGAAGYGAFTLIKKDSFKAETLGVAAGIGFFAGMIVGIFDATITDTALINYDSKSQQFAFGVPTTFGSEVRLLNIRF